VQDERARVDAVSATMPRSCSQSVHSGPRASRISTARACGRADSERPRDAVVADHRRGEADDLLAKLGSVTTSW
jgi:hypothetical protein